MIYQSVLVFGTHQGIDNMTQDINFGQITEALNDKADRDLYNVSPTSGGGG